MGIFFFTYYIQSDQSGQIITVLSLRNDNIPSLYIQNVVDKNFEVISNFPAAEEVEQRDDRRLFLEQI